MFMWIFYVVFGSFSYRSKVLLKGVRVLPNIVGIIADWGRWSEMVAVELPDIMSGSIMFKNILYI